MSRNESKAAARAGELGAALRSVAELRHLHAREEIQLVQVNASEMRAEVERYIRSEYPKEVIAGQAELLKALGLVPGDFDYVAMSLELVGERLAGFYNPKSDAMFLADSLNPQERSVTLRHEVIHALQDQHYDLASGLAYRPDGADAQSARHSLAEGDATSALLDEELGPDAILADEYLLSTRFSAGFASDVKVPEILKRSAVAPYVDGLLFVNGLRRSGGWDAVKQAWRDPPQTSEQLLHPQKYLRREPSRAMPRMPPRSGCQSTYTDVLGEQALRLVFEDWASTEDAKQAAAGWDGDRVTVHNCAGAVQVRWTLAFDTATDASEAEQLFATGRTLCEEVTEANWQITRADKLVSVRVVPTGDCYAQRPPATP